MEKKHHLNVVVPAAAPGSRMFGQVVGALVQIGTLVGGRRREARASHQRRQEIDCEMRRFGYIIYPINYIYPNNSRTPITYTWVIAQKG